MRKNGFTMIELLAVIVVLGLILTIAVPGIMNTNKKARVKAYNTKIKMSEQAATMYAQDSKTSSTGYKVLRVTNKQLINEGYLETDEQKTTCTSKCLSDPRDGSKYLDCDVITIEIRNNNIKVTNYENKSNTNPVC